MLACDCCPHTYLVLGTGNQVFFIACKTAFPLWAEAINL